MFTLVFIGVIVAVVVALALSGLIRRAAERQLVFRSGEPPERQLEEQDRLRAIREAQERAREEARKPRD